MNKVDPNALESMAGVRNEEEGDGGPDEDKMEARLLLDAIEGEEKAEDAEGEEVECDAMGDDVAMLNISVERKDRIPRMQALPARRLSNEDEDDGGGREEETERSL